MRKVIKKFILSLLLIIFLILQISFLSYLIKGLRNNDMRDVVMKYNQNGKISYNVTLKENDLIPEEYKNDDDAYILSLVDHITIMPHYSFSSNKKTKINGNSKVYARLKVYYKESSTSSDNPEVLKKEDVLLNDKISFNNKEYNKANNYDIYLDEYLKVLDKFKEDVKINVDGYLEILQEVKLNGEVKNTSYKTKYETMLKIPLSNSVIRFESNQKDSVDEYVYDNELVKNNNIVKIYVVIVNIIIFFILMVLLKSLFKITNKTKYEKDLNRILRNYDDIIVNTHSMVDVKKYKVIKISDFKEMLNLSRELLLPIMNYEMRKNVETCFYIIKDDILYMYIIYDKNKMNLEEDKD